MQTFKMSFVLVPQDEHERGGAPTRASAYRILRRRLVVVAVAVVVRAVVVRGAVGGGDALLDGGFVVPNVPELAALFVAEYFERRAEFFEFALVLGAHLGRRVHVPVPHNESIDLCFVLCNSVVSRPTWTIDGSQRRRWTCRSGWHSSERVR